MKPSDPEDECALLAQVLAEEDAYCGKVLASLWKRCSFDERVTLIEGLVEQLDDHRKTEVHRRYSIIRAVNERL